MFFLLTHSREKPSVLWNVATFLNTFRGQGSRDFVSFAVKATKGFHNEFEQESDSTYRKGLIILGCTLMGIFILWTSFILVFKIFGRRVGCASGAPFSREKDEEIFFPFKSHDATTTDVEGYGDSQEESQHQHSTNEKPYSGHEEGEEVIAADSFGSSIESTDDLGEEVVRDPRQTTFDGSVASEESQDISSVRETRTRWAFIIFALLNLVSVAGFFVLSHQPVSDAMKSFPLYTDETRSIIRSVNENKKTTSLLLNKTISKLNDMSFEYDNICPMVNETSFAEEIGFSLQSMLSIFENDYPSIQSQFEQEVLNVSELLLSVEHGVSEIEIYQENATEYIMYFPLIVVAIGTLSAILIAANYYSFRRESSQDTQKILAYIILPLYIVSTIICWLGMVMMAFSSVVTNDACTQNQRSGSPIETVSALLEAYGYDESTMLYKYIVAYATGCFEADPREVLIDLGDFTQTALDESWRFIALIDTSGVDTLSSKCGGSFEEFFDLALTVTRGFTIAQDSFEDLVSSLSCESAASIYENSVNRSVCSQIGVGAAWGFLCVALAGVSSLVIITLRSVLYHRGHEDKVYSEEEVAENMILDEHEEYLHYISKYRHEWQEYEGIDTPVHEEEFQNEPYSD